MGLILKVKFIVDHNVGKLVKWLRMMGYDTQFFTGDDDWEMIISALNEGRVILTRDTQIMRRGVIANGRLKAILIQSEEPRLQMQQVVDTLSLDCQSNLFTLCLECNQSLEERTKPEVEGRVPPYVFQKHDKYMGCPSCHRIYWKGTHWRAMIRKLETLKSG
jgi:uncharacterized protein with PIN domain